LAVGVVPPGLGVSVDHFAATQDAAATAVPLLAVGVALHVVKGLEVGEALIDLCALGLLLAGRRCCWAEPTLPDPVTGRAFAAGAKPGMLVPSQLSVSGRSAFHSEIRCPAWLSTTAWTDIGEVAAARSRADDE
jgi:hypothetical protein